MQGTAGINLVELYCSLTKRYNITGAENVTRKGRKDNSVDSIVKDNPVL